jgi:hypothetical protein
MISKKINIVERVYAHENGSDFNTLFELIVTNKIEELVHNFNKVNTATSHSTMKGFEKI